MTSQDKADQPGKKAQNPASGAAARRPDQPKPEKPAARPQAAAPKPVPGPSRPAKVGRRHRMIALSFVVVVLAPLAVAAWYLWARAADQYASYVGFSVRSESAPNPADVLGGLGSLVGVSTNSTSDTDILYKFIQSHDLVARIDDQLDLRKIWSKPADSDPFFSYSGDGSLEDLLDEWERKVSVYYDAGMIDVRVQAFDPDDAQAIAQAVMDESSRMINDINDVAREDALRYAREDLDQGLERLKEARQSMTSFRNEHLLVDPAADVEGQAGIVVTLQQQLAEALINLAVLRAQAQPGDPRIEQAELRVQVIREQIDQERRKFGTETTDGQRLSEVVGQYEGLVVDREFAETSYTVALAALDAARAEAQRQSRYLAAYVQPTRADQPEYPERGKLIGILAGFLLLIWLIGVMIFYSLRDRR